MRLVRILDEAAEEASAAAAWYEKERTGLGLEFFEAVEAGLDIIEEGTQPLLPIISTTNILEAKRLILQRFPYDIVALERSDEIIVIAIAHHSRQPGYWKDR